MTRKALDQSSRYADLSLDEATLIKRLSCKVELPCNFRPTEFMLSPGTASTCWSRTS